MSKKKAAMQETSREVLEQMAVIFGPMSAAAQALAEADAHKGITKFYYSGASIVVERLPPEAA